MITDVIASRRHKRAVLNFALSLSWKRSPGADEDDGEVGDIIPAGESPDPPEAVIARETAREISEAASARLTALEVQALAWHLEGLSYVDMASRRIRTRTE